MDNTVVIHSEAVYGARTKKPLVKFTFGSEQTVMSTNDARKLAYDILDVAHASDGDAFLVHYGQRKIGLSEQDAVKLLADFRDERVRMNGEQ